MTQVLDELVQLLALERIEKDLFRGRSQDLGWGMVFGGQVCGQALSAAAQTVPDERLVHSLHGYFLRPGRVDMPVVYEVDRIRDGKSFTTRRVVAIQNGKAIFNLSASFQIDEGGFEHADTMPETQPPEELASYADLAERVRDQLPERVRAQLLSERPIELRPADAVNPLRPGSEEPRQRIWYGVRGELADDPSLHRYLLAYASDFQFLPTALRPHGVSLLTPGMQVASLDHAMWFHRPFRMDEWLLHDIESPSASGARALVRGRFFRRDGTLVASTVQEGLVRDRRDG